MSDGMWDRVMAVVGDDLVAFCDQSGIELDRLEKIRAGESLSSLELALIAEVAHRRDGRTTVEHLLFGEDLDRHRKFLNEIIHGLQRERADLMRQVEELEDQAAQAGFVRPSELAPLKSAAADDALLAASERIEAEIESGALDGSDAAAVARSIRSSMSLNLTDLLG